MNRSHPQLERLLEEARHAPVSLPAGHDFEAAVWRRIAREEEAGVVAGFRVWCERLASMALQPRRVAAALAMVLCGAVGVTALATRSGFHSAPAVSLGLEVFSGHAPALPSTLIAHHP